MASITIRNLEEATKRKLKIRAAIHGRSMEQEAREILKSALRSVPSKSGANLAEAIRRRFAPLGEATGIGGVKLTIEAPFQDFGQRSRIQLREKPSRLAVIACRF